MSTLDRVPQDWPNRTASQSVRIGALEWHVQVAGSGPALCLLHGTGSSAHSWGPMLPMLARGATVIAPDLPGHGFTTGASRRSLTLPAIASELRRLIDVLSIRGPLYLVGHSAGAALALRWALDARETPPAAILGFNPSLVAPPSVYTRLLGPLITPVATAGPVTALLASLVARRGTIDRLLDSTGSHVPPMQRDCYARLFRNPAQIAGAMAFMAAADLPAIERAAARLTMPMEFIVGAADRWVPPRPLLRVIARAFPAAVVREWPGGHLLHEVEPAAAVVAIEQWMSGVAGRPAPIMPA